ncbi:MAG: DinB family protein [Crocinitomicaceae bacterium]
MFRILLIIFGLTLTTQAYANTMETSSDTTEMDSLDWIIDELIVKWTNNKSYTMDIIEAMPESDYNFTPADDMMSFQEQAVHITTTLHWQMEKLGLNEIPEFNGETKDEIMTSYETLFDYIIAELESMKGAQLSDSVEVFYGNSTKRRLLNLMDNHVAHHRGQLIVYLRLKGIKPARYKGW